MSFFSSRPFSSKNRIRSKNSTADASVKPKFEPYKSAGIPRFADQPYSDFRQREIWHWKEVLARSIGEESFDPDTSSWQLACVEHCKTTDASQGEHEFLICQLFDTETQRNLFFRLERVFCTPRLGRLEKIYSSCPDPDRTFPDEMDNIVPHQSLNAMTVTLSRGPLVRRSTTVLADFRLSPNGSAKVTQCDLLHASLGAGKASDGLRHLPYIG